MRRKGFLFFTFFILFSSILLAQEDSLAVEELEPNAKEEFKGKEKEYKEYNALAPAKAAFYSAVLPGLGQAYNGRYWKIPLVYGGIGTGIYFYLDNDKKYDRYRDAYKDRLAGREDEFLGKVSTDGLRRAQELYQKNKEISLLVTAGIYLLNIIDANVDAHLQQFNVDKDLSFRPKLNYDQFSGKTNYGLSLNFNF